MGITSTVGGDRVQGSANSPAQNTCQIDWLSFTVVGTLENVLASLGLVSNMFELSECRYRGYTGRLYRSGVTVYFGKGDLVHVDLSGSGCSDVRGILGSDRALATVGCGGTVTRLDLAYDVFDRSLDIEQVEEYVRQGNVRTRWSTYEPVQVFKLGGEGTCEGGGKTLYFGRREESRLYLCIYDKDAEQRAKGYSSCTDWTRVELRSRGDRAQELCASLAEGLGNSAVMLGVLKSYLNFVTPTEDSNRARWPIATWWADFLSGVEKVRLCGEVIKGSVVKRKRWLEDHLAQTLGVVLESFKGGGGIFQFREYIDQIAREGISRFGKRHWEELEEWRAISLV